MVLLPLYTRVSGFNTERVSKDFFMCISLVAIIALLPKPKRDNHFLVISLCVAVFLATLANQWLPASSAVQCQYIIISCSILFVLAFSEKFNKSSVNLIINGIAIACIVQSSIGILQEYNIRPYHEFMLWLNLDNPTMKKIAMAPAIYPLGILGTIDNPNLFGAFVSISSTALWRKGWCWFLPVALIAVGMSKSELAMATALFVPIAMLNWSFVSKYKYWLSALLIGSYLLFIAFDPFGVENSRWGILKTVASQLTTGGFALGMGPGWLYDQGFPSALFKLGLSTPEVQKLGATSFIRQVHFEQAEAIVLWGIPLALLSIFLWIKAIPKEYSVFGLILVVVFFNSLGNFTLHYPPTAIMFLISLAICLPRRFA